MVKSKTLNCLLEVCVLLPIQHVMPDKGLCFLCASVLPDTKESSHPNRRDGVAIVNEFLWIWVSFRFCLNGFSVGSGGSSFLVCLFVSFETGSNVSHTDLELTM